ncbi:hypothetical protein HYV91_02245 [Candidatus Wolfebacteria bacterium]|nr:hypothetical protein [Candidatus Wolfebacteria bacterium]
MTSIYLTERQVRKRERGRKIKFYGVFGASIFLLGGLIYAVFYSPLFKVASIQIVVETSDFLRGEDKLIFEKQLIENFRGELSNKPLLSKFLGEDNILNWYLKNSGMAESVKQKYPYLANISIQKNIFKRQIDILVSRREYFGVWCLSEECWWFDKSGVIFAEAPRIDGELTYQVRDDTQNRALGIGSKILDDRLLPNLFKIFDVLEKSDFRWRSLKLENLDLEEITTGSELNPQIYFSLRNDPSSALLVLQSAKQSGLDKAQYIDLRVENRVYYK